MMHPLQVGAHHLDVLAYTAADSATIIARSSLGDAPFQAQHLDAGWHVIRLRSMSRVRANEAWTIAVTHADETLAEARITAVQIRGDLDHNDVVDANDLAALKRLVAAPEDARSPSAAVSERADLNDDGRITADDSELLRAVVEDGNEPPTVDFGSSLWSPDDITDEAIQELIVGLRSPARARADYCYLALFSIDRRAIPALLAAAREPTDATFIGRWPYSQKSSAPVRIPIGDVSLLVIEAMRLSRPSSFIKTTYTELRDASLPMDLTRREALIHAYEVWQDAHEGTAAHMRPDLEFPEGISPPIALVNDLPMLSPEP
ncbi:MAG: dockerin type I repeat-containing protein [Planctomycetes bacterium]|nr:dockerin type I repeat-containing protein [Planctomycetota bacterium]